MSILTDNVAAVDELIAAASEEALGFPAAQVDGVEVEAVVSEIELDEILVAGGTAEGGGYSLIVRASDFPGGAPAKFIYVEVRGIQLQILRVVRGVAHYVLTIGDPAEDT